MNMHINMLLQWLIAGYIEYNQGYTARIDNIERDSTKQILYSTIEYTICTSTSDDDITDTDVKQQTT